MKKRPPGPFIQMAAEKPTILVQMMRTAANGEPVSKDQRISSAEQSWLTATGLGPLLFYLLKSSGWEEAEIPEIICGAHLVARLNASVMTTGLHRVTSLLNKAGIDAIPIKGVSIASRYYPDPSLRVMRDVDLLVPDDYRSKCLDVLLDSGFDREAGEIDEMYSDHHHAVPLYSTNDKIWVELHSALLPIDQRISDSDITTLRTLEEARVKEDAFPFQWGLKREVELGLLATGWCRDLGADFGQRGLTRALFDAIYISKQSEFLDVDWLLDTCKHQWSGQCLAFLFGFLYRHGALSANSRLDKLADQPAQRRITTRLAHSLLDDRLLKDNGATLLSNANVAFILNGLTSPGSDWSRLWSTVQGVALGAHGGEDMRATLVERLSSLVRRGRAKYFD